MAREPVDRPSAERLYALRLGPGRRPQEGLQGEVEHVVSGERCRFQSAADLVAWLQSRLDAAAADAPQAGADAGGAPAPRDATR